MTIRFNDEWDIVRVIEDTTGGDTYVVCKVGESNVQRLCFRPKKGTSKSGDPIPCTHQAGWQTTHPGEGACKFHGGSNLAMITSGNRSVKTHRKLTEKINDYLTKDRSELLSLDSQLAAMKVIFDDFIEVFPDPTDGNYGLYLSRLLNIVSTLSTTAEKISKIEARSTLTAAQVLYLKVIIVELLMKYIPSPEDRIRATRELSYKMGGDVSVELERSEVYSDIDV